MNSLRTLILSSTRTLFAVVLLVAAFLTAGSAMGQAAYFSLEGDLHVTGAEHNFLFALFPFVGSERDLRFRTYHYEGGTNAAGDSIWYGWRAGFDPVLELFNSSDASRGFNDDGPSLNRDSLLTWVPYGSSGTALTDPLWPDSYRLNLINKGHSVIGPWAVDLIGPADAITFTGATPTGSSTIDSLKFGTTGGGTAVYKHSSGTLTLLDKLVVANTGNARLNLSGGVITVNGTLTVKAGGTINHTSGTFNAGALANGGVMLVAGALNVTNTATVNAGGTINHTSGTFNADTTIINAGGTFNHTGGTFNAGTLVNGGSMDVAGTVNVTNATINASLDVQSGGTFNADTTIINAGGTFNHTGGTFNANGPFTVKGGTLNRGSSGNFNLASGQTLTATNNAQIDFTGDYQIDNGTTFDLQSGADLMVSQFLDIGSSVGGDGTLIVDGAGSSV